MGSSAAWQDRALRAAQSIVEANGVTLDPATETTVLRLMTISWLYGVEAGTNGTLERVQDALGEVTARL